MGNGFAFIDIILFAMVAVFLVFRLRGVLGRRTGHEKRPSDPFARTPEKTGWSRNQQDKVIPLPPRTAPSAGSGEAAAPTETEAETAVDPVAEGLKRIADADPSFTAEGFLEGARTGFSWIVEGFAKGDTKALRPLLSNEVYTNFAEAVEARKKAGETLEFSLVGIKSTAILEAELQGRTAFVTVKFVSEQVNVTRDSAGKVVDGDPVRIVAVTDIWTFARNTRSRDPNWTLVATRSPN